MLKHDADGKLFKSSNEVFRSIKKEWLHTLYNRESVKELIPDFFIDDASFLTNLMRLDLGVPSTTSKTKSNVKRNDHVKLPNWASSPSDFLKKHREALESEHVSRNLHKWIDMVFGVRPQPKLV